MEPDFEPLCYRFEDWEFSIVVRHNVHAIVQIKTNDKHVQLHIFALFNTN